MRSASVEDAILGAFAKQLDDGRVEERFVQLFRPEDIQMPKPPEDAAKSEPKPEEQWVVEHAEAPARQPERKILY